MSKEENRKLTPAEEARSIRFEETKKELLSRGYRAEEMTIGIVYANVMAVVLVLPLVICLAVLFCLCNAELFSGGFTPGVDRIVKLAIFLVLLFVLTAVHEFLHGITWAMFAEKGWKSLAFGFVAQYMTPYCSCDSALKKWQYILGSIMPTLILGVIPAVVAIATGSAAVFVMAAIMIFGGGGDLTVILKILRFKAEGREVLYIDHPWKVGLVAFVK